ncbi:MAG: hypothetical protein ACI4F9_06590 [Lachnospiraceae bacterium]
MLKENDSILYTREEMFLVLKEIEFILSSLDHMESYYYDRDKKEYEVETTRFINNSLVCSRLAAIRTILSIPFDKDLSTEEQEAIDDILSEETPSWKKPGDYCDDVWVEERASEVLAALDNPIEKIHIIQQLKNQKLVSIGRDGDFFSIYFGAEIIEENDYDNERKRGEYFLDFQCKWRIEDCQSRAIKLVSEDMYNACFTVERAETLEWNGSGNNAFDEKIMTLFPDNEEIQVKNVSLSENGDLELVFSNDLVLLCFAIDSSVEEWWRFYSYSSCDHFVVSGSRV